MRQAIQELQPQGAKPGQAGLLWPVFLSALMTLGSLLGVYQTFGEHTPGLLVPVLAGLAAPFLGDAVIAEMTCVGSVLIIGLGLNMLGLTKLKVMNYLPAIFLPILLCLLW